MTLDVDVTGTFTDADEAFTVTADLTVERGETLVVLGPSGSGKSLLLELVAGFHDADGHVRLDGVDLVDAPPEERGTGMVFQNYALFEHMTVAENVAFGARYHENPRDADDVLDALGVADLAERSPDTLSGGESQRVALARALAVRPDVFLLDEPLSALDAPTRDALRRVLLDVLDGETAVYVTHDRTTARALGDRVAVMHGGELQQVGTPDEIFERPGSAFVARFTGANVLTRDSLPDAVTARLPAGERVVVRPEHVTLDPASADAGESGVLSAAVERVVREDAAYRVTVALDDAGTRLDAFAAEPPGGERVSVSFAAGALHVPRDRAKPEEGEAEV
ncbi:hypothetical protein GCM10009039_04650 [Halocalculus aciditolerans]|uniref:Molybdate/tungstate import ATP-binding protein WtpC n=1 Tax=Halocalculus aciditolerans TaxID=1383812 RepID=A0A830FFC6_9EURY|nr:hypothetical protein GCM10009039_04650 [Halocalculus aciditolerans]